MNTYLDLADSLVQHAEQQPGSYVSEALMRQAAAALRMQADSIAELEKTVNKLESENNQLRRKPKLGLIT